MTNHRPGNGLCAHSWSDYWSMNCSMIQRANLWFVSAGLRLICQSIVTAPEAISSMILCYNKSSENVSFVHQVMYTPGGLSRGLLEGVLLEGHSWRVPSWRRASWRVPRFFSQENESCFSTRTRVLIFHQKMGFVFT